MSVHNKGAVSPVSSEREDIPEALKRRGISSIPSTGAEIILTPTVSAMVPINMVQRPHPGNLQLPRARDLGCDELAGRRRSTVALASQRC